MNSHIDEPGDTEAHVYIPKEERAGARSDTAGHGRRGPKGDDTADTEAHGRRPPGLEDADDAIDLDTEGHGRRTPNDPVNEPLAVRARDGRAHR